MTGHTVGAPDNAGDGDAGTQKLCALDALLPEQCLARIGNHLQKGLRLRLAVGFQPPGDTLLPPQVADTDGTFIGFDGDAEHIAIVIIDIQQDLPPTGFSLFRLQLALFVDHALRQQLSAEGAHCRRGQSQLLSNILPGSGTMIVEKLQNLTAIPALYAQKIDSRVTHFLLPPMSIYE